jgi:hypothetical protein
MALDNIRGGGVWSGFWLSWGITVQSFSRIFYGGSMQGLVYKSLNRVQSSG